MLLFDFQAHGESEGNRITFGFLEGRDARAAIRFAKEKMPKARMGVIGLSQGGAAAVLGPNPIEADALVLEAVYPDIRVATDNRIRRRLGPFSSILTPMFMQLLSLRVGATEADLRPVDKIGRFKKPVLILSGSVDPLTTVADTHALYATANNPKQEIFFAGAGHVDLYDFDSARYEKIVGEFFRENLEGVRER